LDKNDLEERPNLDTENFSFNNTSALDIPGLRANDTPHISKKEKTGLSNKKKILKGVITDDKKIPFE
jgi:hypothetical protein